MKKNLCSLECYQFHFSFCMFTQHCFPNIAETKSSLYLCSKMPVDVKVEHAFPTFSMINC